jgi:GH15 family glucan-1,4-alpha-glucosidase
MEGLKVDAPIEVCRLLRPLSGTPRLRVHFDPQPDYARSNFEIIASAQGVQVVGGPTRLYLSTNVAAPYLQDGTAIRIDRPTYFSLSAGKPSDINSAPDAENALEQTIRGWRVWARTTHLPSFAADAVLRSALCLKLHAFSDTGAIIAAATTSIPEALHSGRTWDYRFCWLRDAAFVVEALRRLSHLAEGEAFVRFLRNMADNGPLQPIYSITGQRDLHEEIVTTLRGYEGAGPVRIGNAAYVQRQHDVDGEMVLCLETILTDPRVVWEDPSLAPLLERRRRHRTVGIPYPAAALHLLEGDVLGGSPPRRGTGGVSRHARPGRALERMGGREAADHSRACVQRGARVFHAGLRRRPS